MLDYKLNTLGEIVVFEVNGSLAFISGGPRFYPM